MHRHFKIDQLPAGQPIPVEGLLISTPHSHSPAGARHCRENAYCSVKEQRK